MVFFFFCFCVCFLFCKGESMSSCSCAFMVPRAELYFGVLVAFLGWREG